MTNSEDFGVPTSSPPVSDLSYRDYLVVSHTRDHSSGRRDGCTGNVPTKTEIKLRCISRRTGISGGWTEEGEREVHKSIPLTKRLRPVP